MLLLVLALLQSPGAAPVWQRSPPRSEHVGIMPQDGGHPLVMAVGDELHLRAERYRCYYDVCERIVSRAPVAWIALTPGISVSSRGVARAAKAGHFLIRATIGRQARVDSIRVLPPVTALSWTPHPDTLFVGDTLRIATLALDSQHAVVGHLTLSEHHSGPTEVLSYADSGATVLYVARPGQIFLVGRLAHRTDTLRLTAITRSESSGTPEQGHSGAGTRGERTDAVTLESDRQAARSLMGRNSRKWNFRRRA